MSAPSALFMLLLLPREALWTGRTPLHMQFSIDVLVLFGHAKRKLRSSRLLATPPRKGLQAEELNFQAVIKSAACTTCLDLQGSLAGPAVRMPSRRPVAPLQIPREAALAADLIKASKS